jgi:hypothetical protein
MYLDPSQRTIGALDPSVAVSEASSQKAAPSVIAIGRAPHLVHLWLRLQQLYPYDHAQLHRAVYQYLAAFTCSQSKLLHIHDIHTYR